MAAYLYNGPEYLEVYVAAFKAGLAPVNTNYRYGPDEIVYLFDNADAEAVVFHASFTDLLEKVRDQLPKVRRWYVVADDAGDGPEWAVPYEAVVAGGADRVVAPWGRSGDDLLLLYTGGTTGMPKGVMWRQDDLFNVLGAGGNPILGVPPAADVAEVISRIDPAVPGMVLLSACPLMHGTGQFTALNAMAVGGAVVTLPSRHFRAAELWAEVERLKVNTVVIVGQAFAGPMLDELDAHPDSYDLSSVFLVVSSGVMWSQENKDGLLRHLPRCRPVRLVRLVGGRRPRRLGERRRARRRRRRSSSSASGWRCSPTTGAGSSRAPPSRAWWPSSGFIPVGYYKDEAKTASTFRTFEDRRWSVPGDWAEVNPDGTLKLLGRGSVCINTGGEKVFPEEVEEVLKTHPAVRDAVAVGLPDERFGEVITAVVEPAEASDAVTLETLAAYVKERLAAYKAPRHVVVVDTIGRAPNGKVDYKRLKALAAERVARP